MERSKLIAAQQWIKYQLDGCIGFWLDNAMDTENGGVYTCLDRKGKVYSTDKSVWMQGRCGWMFASLCKIYGKKEDWLSASKSCLDFLENHCINTDMGGRMYFTVTEDGKPLRQRRYCFSEGFYAIANAEYYGVTNEEIYLQRAKRAYELIYNLNKGLIKDPTGMPSKTITKTREGRSLASPMIFLNITQTLRRVDPNNAQYYTEKATECVKEIFDYHYHPELGCTLESVALDGTAHLDFTAGRTVNPGHDIECVWFLLEEAAYQGDKQIEKKAYEMFKLAIEAGWDKEYGGILYFIDCLGKPTEAYEHDMKLWWPHNETLIAAMMAYKNTKDEYYLEWFYKVLEYSKKYFADEEYGEWYGYLRRDGKPTEPSTKGSTFKGPFHLPRSLSMVDVMISEILNKV